MSSILASEAIDVQRTREFLDNTVRMRPESGEVSDRKPEPSGPLDALPALDPVDAALVRELVADGRASVSALAERVNVSRATALLADSSGSSRAA